ncbi:MULTISPECIES: aminoglycoside phosphotransferase family protein [Actinoalloteichus]|uniref:aminoglycoside phosphotransferase family protein n=1 Tax=Actinoalloteichus TaxID=65496 RepID=UPI00040789D6|nr:aminoglycoside 3'-phosphotransferase/choline kinase family protein [Actinoalloteichus caeruleus]
MSGGSLPEATTVARFEAVVEDEARLRPGVVELCRRLGIGGELVRFADGSLPVYAVGEDLVLTLYPPVHAGEAAVEAGVLDLVAGRLPVATPRVHQVGVRDGWAYVLMSRLRGRPLGEVWPALSPAERRSVAARVGGALAALHEVDHRGLDVLGRLAGRSSSPPSGRVACGGSGLGGCRRPGWSRSRTSWTRPRCRRGGRCCCTPR